MLVLWSAGGLSEAQIPELQVDKEEEMKNFGMDQSSLLTAAAAHQI